MSVRCLHVARKGMQLLVHWSPRTTSTDRPESSHLVQLLAKLLQFLGLARTGTVAQCERVLGHLQ